MNIWRKVFNHYQPKLATGHLNMTEQVQLCTSLLHYVCINHATVKETMKDFEKEGNKVLSMCGESKHDIDAKCTDIIDVFSKNWDSIMDMNAEIQQYISTVILKLFKRHRYTDRQDRNKGIGVASYRDNFKLYTITTLSKNQELSPYQLLHLLVPILYELERFYDKNATIKEGLDIGVRYVKHYVYKHNDGSQIKNLSSIIDATMSAEKSTLFETAEELLNYAYDSDKIKIINFYEN